MAYNQDQMDAGPPGRMRGQPSHVRIPQHIINRSLRTGVSPSMQQMHNGQGHFQGAPQGGHPPFRAYPSRGPQKSQMFNRFMNRATGGPFANKLRNKQDFPGHGQGADQHMNFQNMEHLMHQNQMAQHNPIMQQLINKTKQGANGFQGHGPFNGGPIIGNLPGMAHQQQIAHMVQAMMGDLGGGMSADQYQNMMGGTLPGQEHGDFMQALGAGAGNDSPLKALAAYLTQGANGQYNIDSGNQDTMHAIQQLLTQATGAHNPMAPPAPPGLFPGHGGNGGQGGGFHPIVPNRNPFGPGGRPPWMPGRGPRGGGGRGGWLRGGYPVRGPIMQFPLNTSGGIPQAGLPR